MKITPAARNPRFRFLPLGLLLLSVPLMAAQPAPKSARKQVYQQAVALASADLSRIGQVHNWPTFTSKLNVFIPGEVDGLARCARPLTYALPAGNTAQLARLRYDIRCGDPQGWELAVTVKPDVWLPVLVAKKGLTREHVLTASDVVMKKRNVVTLRDGFMTQPDEAIGLMLKKRVREFQAITPAHLTQPLLISRGQQVLMLAEQDGVQAKMLGEAMKNGRKGEIIKVRNVQSRRTVSAQVADRGVVRMLMAPGTP